MGRRSQEGKRGMKDKLDKLVEATEKVVKPKEKLQKPSKSE